MLRALFSFFLVLFASNLFAQSLQQPLEADQAFVFSSYLNDQKQLIFQWKIAPGYYLYQKKMNFFSIEKALLPFASIQWPKPNIHQDVSGNSQAVYGGLLKLKIPLAKFNGPQQWSVSYQGCSLNGFCYPPIKKIIYYNAQSAKPFQELTVPTVVIVPDAYHVMSSQHFSENIFIGHNLFFVLVTFFGIGLLLAFTPCVLPMIPILSGIIVGHREHKNAWYSFRLSLAYVLGMAITYALAGLLVVTLGSHTQSFFQNTYVILLFSGFFVLLALSLFGAYELQLPQKIQCYTIHLSNRLQSSSYIGVFLMGCLSTLIVSPCVTAPLVGVLAYISQSGNLMLGGAALFMLGMGMGIPLLIVGTSAGRWLPRVGAWMHLVKHTFGFLMLGVAIWMLSRILAAPITFLLWAVLFLGIGIYFILSYRVVNKLHALLSMIGCLCLIYSLFLFIDAWQTSPGFWFQPKNTAFFQKQKRYFSLFQTVDNWEDFHRLANEAIEHQQIMIVDFYATWCVSCVAMDKQVFKQGVINVMLDNMMRVRVDVTKMTEFDKQIMRSYHVIAPPTILFFNREGKELPSKRIVGEMSQEEFLTHINKIKER